MKYVKKQLTIKPKKMFRVYQLEKKNGVTTLVDCKLTGREFNTLGEAISKLNEVKNQYEEYTIIQIFK